MVNITVVDSEDVSEDIYELLLKYDSEFEPPLSSRESTIQDSGLDSINKNSIQEYLESCLEQNLIAAYKNSDFIGFLSYRYREKIPNLNKYTPALYISTTIIEEKYRKEGIATKMNTYLFENKLPGIDCKYVIRRTWRTNHASINYIKSLGFSEIYVIPDDRGEGIDTIYFGAEKTTLINKCSN